MRSSCAESRDSFSSLSRCFPRRSRSRTVAVTAGSSRLRPSPTARMALTSSPPRICFSTYPLAPAMIEANSASSSANEVSISTRVSGRRVRISRVASMPLPSARRTSITTRSGRTRSASATASATVPASATTRMSPAASSMARSPLRTTSWSSTSITRSGSLRSVAPASAMAISLPPPSAHRPRRWPPSLGDLRPPPSGPRPDRAPSARTTPSARGTVRRRLEPGAARAQGMGGVEFRLPTEVPDGPLDHQGHRLRAEPAGEHPIVPIDRAEQRPCGDLRHLPPGPNRRHRAGLGQGAEGDRDPAPEVAGAPAPDQDLEARLHLLQILAVQPYQLGATQPAGEAEQQQRPVAGGGTGPDRQPLHHQAQLLGRQRPATRGRGTVLLDGGHDPAHAQMPGRRQQVAGGQVHLPDRRQTAAERRGPHPRRRPVGQVEADRLGLGRERDPSPSRAPAAEVRPVTAVGADRVLAPAQLRGDVQDVPEPPHQLAQVHTVL